MKFILITIFKLLFFAPIQEVQIKDADVIRALNVYLDSLDTKVRHQRVKYHLIARVEKSKQRTIVYVAASTNISNFWHNLPSNYSKFKDRLVFWYEDKNKNDDNSGYRDFHTQFRSQLINDCSSEGVYYGEIEEKFIGLNFIGSYRVVVNAGRIESIRKVCEFPDCHFYRRGNAFDPDGNVMFEDGVYDPCSIDKPHKSVKGDYDPWHYIRANSDSATFLELSRKVFGVTITIDTVGNVIQADVSVEKGILDDQIKRKLTNTVLHMPPWNPATVNGKKVMYRFQIGL